MENPDQTPSDADDGRLWQRLSPPIAITLGVVGLWLIFIVVVALVVTHLE